MNKLKEKYEREIMSMLGELSKKAARLQKQKNPFIVNGLNAAQELTSLASDIERSIYVAIAAEKELKK